MGSPRSGSLKSLAFAPITLGRFSWWRAIVVGVLGGAFWTSIVALSIFLASGTAGFLAIRGVSRINPGVVVNSSAAIGAAGVGSLFLAVLLVLPVALDRAVGYRVRIASDGLVIRGMFGRREWPTSIVRSVGEYRAWTSESVEDAASHQVDWVSTSERGVFVEDERGVFVFGREWQRAGSSYETSEYLDDVAGAIAALKQYAETAHRPYRILEGGPTRAYSAHPILRALQRHVRLASPNGGA